jgi:hypothetical protein
MTFGSIYPLTEMNAAPPVREADNLTTIRDPIV